MTNLIGAIRDHTKASKEKNSDAYLLKEISPPIETSKLNPFKYGPNWYRNNVNRMKLKPRKSIYNDGGTITDSYFINQTFALMCATSGRF
jgi:hypothetical protein